MRGSKRSLGIWMDQSCLDISVGIGRTAEEQGGQKQRCQTDPYETVKPASEFSCAPPPNQSGPRSDTKEKGPRGGKIG